MYHVRSYMLCILSLLFVAVCSCSKSDMSNAEYYTEEIIYEGMLPIYGKLLDSIAPGVENDGEVDYCEGIVYLSSWEVRNVLISNAAVVADYSPWRLPTRKEAGVLKGLDSIAGVGDLRYICVDDDGSYYTFKFGGGAVTKAGAKTKYNIRPIRVEYVNPNIIVYL